MKKENVYYYTVFSPWKVTLYDKPINCIDYRVFYLGICVACGFSRTLKGAITCASKPCPGYPKMQAAFYSAESGV